MIILDITKIKSNNKLFYCTLNEFFLSRFNMECFSKFVPTLSIPPVLLVFSLSRNWQTGLLLPLLTFFVFCESCLVNEANLEVMFLLFTDGKKHKAQT